MNLVEMTGKDLPDDQKIKVMVQAVLCWSEHYNGKWQPTKTSDVARPTELHEFAPGRFNRSELGP